MTVLGGVSLEYVLVCIIEVIYALNNDNNYKKYIFLGLAIVLSIAGAILLTKGIKKIKEVVAYNREIIKDESPEKIADNAAAASNISTAKVQNTATKASSSQDSGLMGCLTYILVVIGFSGLVMLFIPQARLYGLIMFAIPAAILLIKVFISLMKAQTDIKKRNKYRAAMIISSVALGISILVGIPVFVKAASESSSYSGSKSGTVTCGYCHRSFSKNSNDGKSIARTHLCSSCYSNYQWGKDYIGK